MNDVKSPITVALYSLPQKQHFQDVIEKKWSEIHPDIPLEISFPRDTYRDPAFLKADVFAYDTDLMTYITENGIAGKIDSDEIDNYSRLFDFVKEGITDEDGTYYGIPFAICNSGMLFDSSDDELKNAESFDEIAGIILNNSDDGGLVISLFDDISYHYMHVFFAINGPDASMNLEALDEKTLDILTEMAILEDDLRSRAGEVPTSQKARASLFDNDASDYRALYSYSEDTAKLQNRKNLSVRFFGYDSINKARPFYCDVVSVNSGIKGMRRELCLELCNLIASEEVFMDYIFYDGKCLNVLPADEELFRQLASDSSAYNAVYTEIMRADNFVERPGTEIYSFTNEGKEILTNLVSERMQAEFLEEAA